MASIFSRYWRAYGALAALLRSPYLYTALILVPLTWGAWAHPFWWDLVLSVVPNMLGFTLGGFAMFLGFGDEKFRAMLAEPDEDAPDSPSVYLSLCATFVHFLLVQVIALIWAILAKATWFYFPWPEPIRALLPTLNTVGGMVGYAFFLYAITSILAATMHVFRAASWYEMHQRKLHDPGSE